MANYTISHSENNRGWTTFWSYVPDWFSRLNNRFYTIKNGQLWLHNDEQNDLRNNFYGTQYGSSVKTVFNEVMAEDKIFKTLVLESDQKWQAALGTNYTESSIAGGQFNTRESRQFTFIRGNEGSTLRGNAAVGIGTISSINNLVIGFNRLPDLLSVGDVLHQLNGSAEEVIGTIEAIDRDLNTVTLDALTIAPVVGYYSYAKKDERAEGEEVRGYCLEVTLSNDQTNDGELFGISTNVVKSYV